MWENIVNFKPLSYKDTVETCELLPRYSRTSNPYSESWRAPYFVAMQFQYIATPPPRLDRRTDFCGASPPCGFHTADTSYTTYCVQKEEGGRVTLRR